MTRRQLALIAVGALAVGAVALSTPQAATARASDPAPVSVETDFDGVYQLATNTATPLETTIFVTDYDGYSGGTELQNATLHLTGDGITSAPVDVPVTSSSDSDSGQGYYLDTYSPEVSATPGVHLVTATVAGDDVATYTSPEFTVYTPGGPHPAATGSLAGKRYAGYFGAVSFLDGRLAYVGIPKRGAPSCTMQQAAANRKFGGCHRYWWDTSTNLLQIGKWIGAPDRSPGSRAIRGVSYYGSLSCTEFGYPAAGSRFAADLTVADEKLYQDEAYVIAEIDLHLTRSGKFTISLVGGGALQRPAAGREYYATYKGSYSIARNGVLELSVTGKHPRHVTGTIGVATNAAGKPRPNQGVLLGLSGLDKHAVGVVRGGNGVDDSVQYGGTDARADWTPQRFDDSAGCRWSCDGGSLDRSVN